MENNSIIDWELIRNITPIIVGIFSIFGVIIGYLSYKKKKSKKENKSSTKISSNNKSVENNSVKISGIRHITNINFNKTTQK